MSVDREFFTVHCVLLKTLMKLFFFNFAILLHKIFYAVQRSKCTKMDAHWRKRVP